LISKIKIAAPLLSNLTLAQDKPNILVNLVYINERSSQYEHQGLHIPDSAGSTPQRWWRSLRRTFADHMAGKSADSLFGRDWESLWSRPITQVRESLRLKDEPIVVGEGIQEAA
jgi:hypothetical protein